MSVTGSYRVELADFSGPLDLLLYLVRRNEVEVLRLPISVITQQFLDFLETLELLDLDLVGDFVVMASTLMEIKSRQVLPQADTGPVDEPAADDDPKGELITRLLAYKRFKEASVALDQRAAEWQQRYPRLADDRPTLDRNHAADPIREVELWDLVSALSRVLQRRVIETSSAIKYDDTPQAVYLTMVAERVRTEGRVPFTAFFAGSNQRSRIVAIFLAVLELLRHQGFRAEQPEAYGEIFVLPPIDTPDLV